MGRNFLYKLSILNLKSALERGGKTGRKMSNKKSTRQQKGRRKS